jgi:hypothetical protein
MNRTKIAKQARQILTARFGTKRFRIAKTGDINVFDVMPNTNQEGWYLYGNLTDAQTRYSLHIAA